MVRTFLRPTQFCALLVGPSSKPTEGQRPVVGDEPRPQDEGKKRQKREEDPKQPAEEGKYRTPTRQTSPVDRSRSRPVCAGGRVSGEAGKLPGPDCHCPRVVSGVARHRSTTHTGLDRDRSLAQSRLGRDRSLT